ncbi:MAG: Asp-tRNA(Asn)/Glu-tRNA(Gln) amidotransferase subunit GatA [Candidatus Omnitrophica bacterium]|nr:Asp-tRNA(Asn)/Glu-tRNA(Gln) amidotransferase subunit GatA [Candidatus Omnitrophota bacterium]
MSKTAGFTIQQARGAIAQGTLDPRELLAGLLDRIGQLNASLGAYIAIDPERLRTQLDERLARGPRGRLFGIPVTVKDNICIAGEETTCASRILAGFRSPYHATVIERLLGEGAIVVPRANMDEFAFGSSTENSSVGPTKNPWDRSRVPGGSSGGSASAVAADLALGALGSDTGGSIRQPAAFCGVVGLKPTYGRISRYGLIAFASSLDQIGPLTRDVTDAALLLSVIAGHDPRDSTSAPVEVPDYLAALGRPLHGLRFGLPAEYFVEGTDPEVRAAVEQAAVTLEGLGMQRVSIRLPHASQAIATYYIVATAEASSNLARYDGVQYGLRSRGDGSLLAMYQRTRAEGFGPEPKRRIMLGTYVLSHGYYDAYYLKGLKVRTLIKRDFDQAFAQCDAIICPTAPTPAFRLGEKLADPLQMYLSDIFTISANLAGIPALSLPCGFTRSGLPIGLQLMAGPFQEATLLQVAHGYEQATEWHRRHPMLN